MTIGNSVTSIGDEVFRGCTGLTSVVIGDSVASIGESAFCYCTGLTSIVIPDSVTSIGYETFSGHGNQFSKIINSEMVILTPITINNHFNNANYVTKVDHLCSERHTFNFLLKKVDFRVFRLYRLDKHSYPRQRDFNRWVCIFRLYRLNDIWNKRQLCGNLCK